MAIPVTTCPQCAQPLAAADIACPQCGYQLPTALADQAVEPSQQASAAPAATAIALPDQETALAPAVALTSPPQPVSAPAPVTIVAAVTAPPRAEVAPVAQPVAQPAKRPRPPVPRRVTRLALTFVVVVAIVSGAAVGASRYFPNLPAVARFIRTSRPTATVVPVGTVLFQDRLTAKAHNWTNDQHCSFASDGYHVRDGYECYAPTAQQRDITLSVSARQLSGPADRRYGLGFRLNTAGDEYLFAIDSKGQWLFGKYIAGVFTTLVPPAASAAIKQGLGSTNTLTVRAIGSHFAFFINNTPVGSADDATLVTGYCGVEGSRDIEIVFTSLKIVKAA